MRLRENFYDPALLRRARANEVSKHISGRTIEEQSLIMNSHIGVIVSLIMIMSSHSHIGVIVSLIMIVRIQLYWCECCDASPPVCSERRVSFNGSGRDLGSGLKQPPSSSASLGYTSTKEIFSGVVY